MAVFAALYVALCFAFAPISYVGIQFRIAEILLLLPFYNKKYCVPVILGTFIANMFSPIGIVDVIFGTAATILVCLIIMLLKDKNFISFAAALINGIIIGLELYFVFGEPLLLSMGTVAVGEFVVVQMGVVAFAGIERANPKFTNMLKNIGERTE